MTVIFIAPVNDWPATSEIKVCIIDDRSEWKSVSKFSGQSIIEELGIHIDSTIN